MAAIFLTVTDLELLAAQAVKFILLVLLVFGGGLNLYKARKEKERSRKMIRSILAVVLFAVAVPVIRWIQIEGSLLNSDKYAIGTTIGPCQVFAKGKGIEFEYESNTVQKYSNCNTFHPIPLNTISRKSKWEILWCDIQNDTLR